MRPNSREIVLFLFLALLAMLSTTATGMELPESRTIEFKRVGEDSFLFRLKAIPSLRTSLPDDNTLVSLATDMLDSHQESALFIELGDCCGHPQRFFKIKVKDTISARIEELDI